VKPADRLGRLCRSRLYLCTGARPDLAEFLDAVLRGGVDLVQVREKGLEAREELRLLEIAAEACERHGALLAVNDRADLAVAAGADVLHLGQDDLPPAIARRIVGDDVLLGLSTHSPEQVASIPPEVQYFCSGPVWSTPTKPGRPAVGLETVKHTASVAELPWFAIGGIEAGERLDAVMAAGASRIVVVRALTQAADPEAAARALVDRLCAT
jgi:thiamine-phosphate pyrophosphorylase